MMRRRHPGPVVVVAALALAAGAALLGNSLSTADSGPVAAAAKAGAPKVVARVRAVSSGRLYAKRRRGGRVVRLVRRDKVYLRDIVAAGPGLKATLRVTVPKGLSASTVLLSLYRHRGTRRPRAKAVTKQFAILPGLGKRRARTGTVKVLREGKRIEARLSR
jgi:hypothetical protein